MKQLRCRCGYVFNLSTIPILGEYMVFPSTSFDAVASEVARLAPTYTPQGLGLAEAVADGLARTSDYQYHCPECSRIVVQEVRAGGVDYVSYRQES